MKFLLLLIVLGASCQNLGQSSNMRPSALTEEKLKEKTLEDFLADKAKLIYGPSVVQKVTIVTRKSLKKSDRPSAGEASISSPFKASIDDESTKVMSDKGDIGSGVILWEEKDAIYLDVTPCHAKISVFTFHSPYAKKRVGVIGCNGKNINKYLIAQR
jgi:hypothetical protein